MQKNGGNVIFHFKGDNTGLNSSLNGIASGMKGLTSKITIGNLAAKGISKTFSIMSANMDGAIARVDTMNNFPNVMKNLGIGAEDSQKAINKLSEKLKGLPTTLDAGARAVQRFTSANGDVGKSTNMFLALNNALLAGGASAEIQSSALEQISQAYAKGKPDMVEWRTLLTAMPAQATQLGKAFGMTSSELGTALRYGDISMDQFMQKVMELNEKGVAGFDNFEIQAKRATGGISTSFTNMKTAIVRGIGNILNKVNESLKSVGGISGVLSKVGKFGEQAFTKIGNVLAKVIPIIIKVAKWIKEHKTLVMALTTAVVAFVVAFKTIQVVTNIINAVKVAFALLNAVMYANPIGIIVAAIAALVAVFVVLWKKCEWFRNFWIGLWNIIVEAVKKAWELIKPVVDFFVKYFKKEFEFIKAVIMIVIAAIKYFVNRIKTDFTTIKNFIKTAITNIANTIKSLPSKIASIPGKIIQLFKEIPGKLLTIGKDIVKGLWKGAKDMQQWVVDKFKGLGKGILKGMKKALGIKSPSKEFAIIGRFSMLGYTKGLEDMQPEVDRAIKGMFNLSPSMTGTMNNTLSPNVNVVNNVNVETDPLGQVVSKIKTFSGGAKNDYNYGYGG